MTLRCEAELPSVHLSCLTEELQAYPVDVQTPCLVSDAKQIHRGWILISLAEELGKLLKVLLVQEIASLTTSGQPLFLQQQDLQQDLHSWKWGNTAQVSEALLDSGNDVGYYLLAIACSVFNRSKNVIFPFCGWMKFPLQYATNCGSTDQTRSLNHPLFVFFSLLFTVLSATHSYWLEMEKGMKQLTPGKSWESFLWPKLVR